MVGERDKLRAQVAELGKQVEDVRRAAAEEKRLAEKAREKEHEAAQLKVHHTVVMHLQKDRVTSTMHRCGKRVSTANILRPYRRGWMVLQVVIDQQRNLVRSKQEELERVRREKEEAEKRLSASEAMVTTLVQEKDRHYHSMRQAEAKGQGLTELQVGGERGRPGVVDLFEKWSEWCACVKRGAVPK